MSAAAVVLPAGWTESDSSVVPVTYYEDVCTQLFSFGTLFVFDKAPSIAPLQEALRIVLRGYPALAGRYQQRKRSFVIQGTDPKQAGVPFVIVPAEAGVPRPTHTSLPSTYQARVSAYQVYWRRAPPFTVKLTLHLDGSATLAPTVSHGIMDGEAYYNFVVLWSKLARDLAGGETPAEQPAFLTDRSSHPKPKRTPKEVYRELRKADLAGHFDSRPQIRRMYTVGPIRSILGGFAIYFSRHTEQRLRVHVHFSKAEVQNIKEAALRTMPERHTFLSSNDALVGHCSQVLSNYLGFHGGGRLNVLMNNRKSLVKGGFQLEEYYGNAWAIDQAEKSAAPLHRMALGEVAALVRDVVRRYEDVPYVVNRAELYEEASRQGLLPPFFKTLGRALVSNNLVRFPILDVDFGAGRPALVVPPNLNEQVLTVPSAAEEGAVDVYCTTLPLRWQLRGLRKPRWQKEFHKYAEPAAGDDASAGQAGSPKTKAKAGASTPASVVAVSPVAADEDSVALPAEREDAVEEAEQQDG